MFCTFLFLYCLFVIYWKRCVHCRAHLNACNNNNNNCKFIIMPMYTIIVWEVRELPVWTERLAWCRDLNCTWATSLSKIGECFSILKHNEFRHGVKIPLVTSQRQSDHKSHDQRSITTVDSPIESERHSWYFNVLLEFHKGAQHQCKIIDSTGF